VSVVSIVDALGLIHLMCYFTTSVWSVITHLFLIHVCLLYERKTCSSKANLCTIISN